MKDIFDGVSLIQNILLSYAESGSAETLKNIQQFIHILNTEVMKIVVYKKQ